MSKTNNPMQTGQNKFQIAMILGLEAIEFLLASIWILIIAPDPKNAFFLGFSLPRLAIFSFAVALIFITGYTAIYIYQHGLSERTHSLFARHTEFWYFFALMMFLADFALLMTPPATMGAFHGYFERLRPLFFVIGLLPIQMAVPSLVERLVKPGKKFLGQILVVFLIMALFWGGIAVTRLGITPEIYFWNVAAMPITLLEFVLILFACMLSLGLVTSLRAHALATPLLIDIILGFLIYLLAVVIWSQTPMVKHYYSLPPVPPYFQPYPFSDAMYLDIGSLSIIRGYGINYGQFTDKPIYMVFLAFLHRLGGFNYDLLTLIQVMVMAFMAPVLYWLGKSFHSRFFGILIALLIIFRQGNALELAHIIASVNPRLFMTEIPTMFGIIIFVWLAFNWLGRRPSHAWLALLAGGLLGAISLIRMNPIALLPAIPLLCMFVYSKHNHAWLKPSLFFLLGFVIMFSLWVFTGVDDQGYSFFLIKIRDVINIRYSPAFQAATAPPPITTSENESTGGTTPGNPQINSPDSSLPVRFVKIDVTKFPAFVVNHTIHNIITSFLALPDSMVESDQDLTNLARRPYWIEAGTQTWQGQVTPGQIPFLFINLMLIAIGLSWSWNRWRWAGMLPLIVFLTYCLSLGFARNSGSRYTVPVDWIVFFYFSLGLLALAQLLPSGLLKLMQAEPADNELSTQPSDQNPYTKRLFHASLILVFVTALLVPLTQVPILTYHQRCQSDFVFPENQSGKDTDTQKSLIGEVLYPRLIIGHTYNFIFHSCGWAIPVELAAPSINLYDTQTIIARFSDPNQLVVDSIYQLDNNSALQLVWQK